MFFLKGILSSRPTKTAVAIALVAAAIAAAAAAATIAATTEAPVPCRSLIRQVHTDAPPFKILQEMEKALYIEARVYIKHQQYGKVRHNTLEHSSIIREVKGKEKKHPNHSKGAS